MVEQKKKEGNLGAFIILAISLVLIGVGILLAYNSVKRLMATVNLDGILGKKDEVKGSKDK